MSNNLRAPKFINYEDDLTNPLCLCEYYNKNNKRSHLCMCCCNCEALDSLCTSMLCCKCYDNNSSSSESTRSKKVQSVLNAIEEVSDRIRIPFPGGARKLSLDFVLSIIALLGYFFIGTINIFFTILTVVFIPMLLYIRFFFSRINSPKNNRIKLAYYLVLNALILVMVIFNNMLYDNELFYVISYEEKLIINILLSLAILLHVFLKYSNPGTVTKTTGSGISSSNNDEFCKKCNVFKGSSTHIGHCPVCSVCVLNRDHHCFWVDNCIGYFNHKWFILYLIHLLVLFLYSITVIYRRLSDVNCTLSIVWSETVNHKNSCLFNSFYSNMSLSILTVLFIQLVPIILYLSLLLIQQTLFLSLGLTQHQLFKLSQKNYRFSLVYFIKDNFTTKKMIRNCLVFLKFRSNETFKRLIETKTVLVDGYHLV